MKTKMYAKLQYGEILIPLALFEKIAGECMLVTTTYGNDGNEALSSAKPIRKFELYSQEDVDTCLAQQALEGN